MTDGYGNSRVVKFDKNGRFIKSAGTRGSEPGQLNLPHTMAMDANGNVYVGDRSNARVQVFDNDLNFKAIYDNVGQSMGGLHFSRAASVSIRVEFDSRTTVWRSSETSPERSTRWNLTERSSGSLARLGSNWESSAPSTRSTAGTPTNSSSRKSRRGGSEDHPAAAAGDRG